jgi:hypothetical protein
MCSKTDMGFSSAPAAGRKPNFKLACWKRQREDSSVRNRREHELNSVPDRWRLFRVMS